MVILDHICILRIGLELACIGGLCGGISYYVVPEGIHGPPTEGLGKFPWGGGLKNQTFRREV